VPIVCIDEVLEDFQIEVIDFMKMDIEGAELNALLGATASLPAGKIRAIAFESVTATLTRVLFSEIFGIY